MFFFKSDRTNYILVIIYIIPFYSSIHLPVNDMSEFLHISF